MVSQRFITMTSVSFRITKHTEDLACTIHSLSQRVVQLEERLAGLEAHLANSEEESPSPEHLASLNNVDQLLRDCRELLAVEPHPQGDPHQETNDGVTCLEAVSPLEAAPFEPLEEVA